MPYDYCSNCKTGRFFENDICEICKIPKRYVEAGNDPSLISKYESAPMPGVKYWE